jgi:PhnB protein
MAQINPYLIFNGQCEEAFNLYKKAFGGEFTMFSRFGDIPNDGTALLPQEERNRVMHVALPIGNTVLMGSDSNSQAGIVTMGDNASISINTASREETDNLFTILSEGGTVKMPLQDTFWGAYFGMFIDKFGVHWMVNFDK